MADEHSDPLASDPLEMNYAVPESVYRAGKSEPMPVIILAGEVNAAMVTTLRQGLSKVRETDETVLFVYVTSTGGDPACGRALYQILRQWRQVAGYDIHVVGMGTVLSAGLYPFLSVPCEKRFMIRDTRVGIHLSQVSLNISFSGNAQMRVELLRERLSEAEAVLRSNELMIGQLVQGSTFTKDELWERALKYYEPSLEEAVARGLIGEIVVL